MYGRKGVEGEGVWCIKEIRKKEITLFKSIEYIDKMYANIHKYKNGGFGVWQDLTSWRSKCVSVVRGCVGGVWVKRELKFVAGLTASEPVGVDVLRGTREPEAGLFAHGQFDKKKIEKT